MFLLRLSRVLPILVCGLAVQGCVQSFSVPRPQAGLLTPCPNPVLVPDPDNASSEEINVERVRVAEWGACNKRKYDDLATWAKKVLR